LCVITFARKSRAAYQRLRRVMRRILFAIAAIVLSSLTLDASERVIPSLVSTEWLADHLEESDLVVVQISFNRGEYNAEHLPGARFLWFNWLAPSTPDLSAEMPAPVRSAFVRVVE
jgi:hypothetical protein